MQCNCKDVFLLLLLTTLLSHWDFSHGKFGLFSKLKASCDSCATHPQVHAGCFGVCIINAGCFSISIIHQTLTWTVGSLTCAQILMQVIAHTDTKYQAAQHNMKFMVSHVYRHTHTHTLHNKTMKNKILLG